MLDNPFYQYIHKSMDTFFIAFEDMDRKISKKFAMCVIFAIISEEHSRAIRYSNYDENVQLAAVAMSFDGIFTMTKLFLKEPKIKEWLK